MCATRDNDPAPAVVIIDDPVAFPEKFRIAVAAQKAILNLPHPARSPDSSVQLE